MSVYMITRMTIHDRAEYDIYADQFMDVFEKFDGKLLSVDEDPQVVGGPIEWDYYPYHGRISTKGWKVDECPN